jgi:2,5-diamino-6-(ribosylamino)-4(3H)-pyrimidinone 5'-phosphate reductase
LPWIGGVGEVVLEKPEERPYVILNAAMTLDGKIASRIGGSDISSSEDWERVHRLRAEADAIMVGVRTVLIDDPKLRVKLPGVRTPPRVVVDSLARTPPTAKILTTVKGAQTIIAVSSKAPKRRLEALRKAGATIIKAGRGRRVDLKALMRTLRRKRVRTLLLEGGGTLNWGMLKAGLVDEVRVTVAPVLVGGSKAVTLVEGEGFRRIRDGFKLKLVDHKHLGDEVILTYRGVRCGWAAGDEDAAG